MNSSLSFSRFGVMSRMSRARSRVCSGGSIVTMCSYIGIWSRCCDDDVADVVALERHGERRERPDHRVARRERVGVAVDLVGLVVAGHRDHAEVGEREHRALPPAAPRSRRTDPRPATRRRSSRSSASRSTRAPLGPDAEQLLSIRLRATWQRGAVTTASSPRRIGAEDSATRAQLLDAAEQLLLEEGYAAVTSRRVAAKAGLKPQLVHYYFRTMDDLFVEVFRRRAEANLARFERTPPRRPLPRRALGGQRRSARRRLHDRVRRAGEPPQGDPGRDRRLRRALAGRAARGAHRRAGGRGHRRRTSSRPRRPSCS